MLSVSVISRELRCAARSPLNYRLRVLVGAVAVFFLGAVLSDQNAAQASGLPLFGALHRTLVAIILLLAPAMTADTISRERREGTLDLLFLTPLTATSVITSKFFTQALHMGTLWLASLPLAIVPILAGGVGVRIILFSLCVQLTCMVLGLVCGLTISTCFRKLLAAVLCSIGLTLCAVMIDFGLLIGAFMPGWNSHTLLGNCLGAFSLIFGWGSFDAFGVGIPGAGGPGNDLILGSNTLLVACFSLLWVILLGHELGRRTRQHEESARVAWLRKVFLQPAFWKDVLKRSMQRKMDTNPLIWLEYRTAWSRSARSITVAVLILVESYVMLVAPLSREFLLLQMATGFCLVLLICVTASSSFQKEKESGAFELLLVAPMTEEELRRGRLQAVWSYYRPAGVVFGLFVLLAFNQYDSGYQTRDLFSSAHLISVCLSAWTGPIAGLYFALKLRHFLPILASTAFCGVLLPYFAWDLLGQIAWFADYSLGLPFASIFRQWTEFSPMAVVATTVLHFVIMNSFSMRTTRLLRSRDFA